MSLNLTYIALRMNETANTKTYSSIIRGISMKDSMPILFCGAMSVNTATTTRLRHRFIKADIVEDRTIRYFGMLIFLIKSPLATIELRLVDVASTKKFHKIMPSKRLLGSPPNLKNLVKTV